MVNIVTTVCVDTKDADRTIQYPMIGRVSHRKRRAIYWKLATTFCCSSLRFNPGDRHLVYTNDDDEVIIEGTDVRNYLKGLGVELVYLPFERFVPPHGWCTRFKNAFYKLDVMSDLARNAADTVILADSDCLWINENERFKTLPGSDERMFLLDPYKRSDPFLKAPHNLSRSDMGELFREIDENYPEPYPVWYGGELIAGRGKGLKLVADELGRLYELLGAPEDKGVYRFANGAGLFDGMEFCTSYVYNRNVIGIQEASEFVKRIWSTVSLNNTGPDDFLLALWHLPAEKDVGLRLLYAAAVNPGSRFWTVERDQFKQYAGEYVGIPGRNAVSSVRYGYAFLARKVSNLLRRFAIR